MRKKTVKNKKFKKPLIVLLVILLILVIIATSAGFFILGKLSKIKSTKIDKSSTALGINTAQFNSDYINNNYINILLIGVDTRDPSTDPGLADSTMILTIDKVHNKIKLTSLMRDMLLDNLRGEGATAGTDQDRLNVIYKQGGGVNGGGQYAIKAINSNFDMNIKDYIKVDFGDFDKIVDAVGGVDINVSAAEVPVANDYIDEVSKLEGITPDHITHAGMQHLTGIQALGYCRIRYVGDEDFQRTERQRTVLLQVFKKLTTLSPTQASSTLDTILPYVETSLSNTEILSDASYILTHKMSNMEQFRLPEDKPGYNFTTYIKGVYFLGWDKAKNDADLLKFIYEDDASKVQTN